ncbi:MAG: hypothetical protein MK052_11665 [Alphaproteobacteria bacterium]|nr:hypothetical protein [Alphaproteobacteria bacterium]
MNDIAFRIKMQLNFAFLYQCIQNREFLEAPLHSVDLVSHHRDALFLTLHKSHHFMELFSFSGGGRLNHGK